MAVEFNDIQQQWIDENPFDFSSLNAVFLNGTLKKSPERSHTAGLMSQSIQIMQACGVDTELIRLVDHQIAHGVYPDMTEHGWDRDDWPEIQQKIMDANILVIGSPIWLGEKSSLATLAVERLYSYSGKQNEQGQYAYYGRAGGCIITGNEDGVKHCSMSILYALQHIGYTIPPPGRCRLDWRNRARPLLSR